MVDGIVVECPCDEPRCDNPGHACFLPGSQEPDGGYCSEHAFAHGFCKGCGDFWGGVESFEFINNGWCDNCRAEFDEPDDDEEYAWDTPYEDLP
jgi:hypothetical protein